MTDLATSDPVSALRTSINDIAKAYKVLFERGCLNYGGGTGAGTFVMVAPGSGNQAGAPGAVAVGAAAAVYLDPADFAITGRTTKYRLRAQLFTNAVAPTTNFTVALAPVATWGGGAGIEPFVNTLGASVASVAFNAPAASSALQGNSGDINAPAAGSYVITITNSGAAAANSRESAAAILEMRQV